MSSSSDDIRYQQQFELPSYLGENPSKDALEALFNEYGFICICKIVNESSNKISFINPFLDKKGDIASKQTDTVDCKGFVPLSSSNKPYEFIYMHVHDGDLKQVILKDINRDWMLSFKQNGLSSYQTKNGVVDLREFKPADNKIKIAEITLIIGDDGYKFSGCGYGDKYAQSSFKMRHFPRP